MVIESILIKDLQFSAELQESLSAAAKQKRLAESKVIAAEGEVMAAKLMREASDILATQSAMQIRYLDTLQTMAKCANTKVIFMPTSDNSTFTGIEGNIIKGEKAKPDMKGVLGYNNMDTM